ncbi:MAG: hypothetical protein JNL74_19665, partial [Fibrobacteres bacterium]|nr:hypothetical protein [Fibrobacterota bacterium]
MMSKLFILILLISTYTAALKIGELPPKLIMQGDSGSCADGSTFNIANYKGKVAVIYYIDPDEREMNEPFYKAMKAADFKEDSFKSIAIVNMAATVIPDFLFESKLKKNQKKYPKTLYVLDKKSMLVSKWGMQDNSSCVTVIASDGRVVWHKCGALMEKEIPVVL